MPLTPRGKKIMKSMKERYGKKKGEQVFYATKNKGKLKGVEKAYLGKAVRQPTETKKEFEMRHAYHKPFMKKPKGFRGGGMDASKSDFKTPSASAPGPGDTGGEGGFNVKDSSTTQIGDRNSSPTSTGKVSVPTTVMNNVQNAVKKGASFVPLGIQLIGKGAYELNKFYRTKKAKGENFLTKKVTLPSTRDYYKVTGKKLDVMSPEGKKYLQEDKRILNPNTPIPTGIGKESNLNLCPDGTLPPCKTTETTTPKTTDPFLSSFKAYSGGGEIVVSSNVDRKLLSGGVRFGPPPKRGPNPNVPPVKMKKGGYKK